MKFVGVGIGFMSQIILARILGLEEFGSFTYVFSWVLLAAVFVRFGFDNYLIKEVRLYLERKEYGSLRAFLHKLRVLALRNALIVDAVVIAALILLFGFDDPKVKLFAIAAAILPVIALTYINQNILIAFKKLYISDIPVLIVRHTVVIILLVATYYLTEGTIGAYTVLVLTLIGFIAAFVISLKWTHEAMPEIDSEASVKAFKGGQIMKEAAPFLWFSGTGIINQRAAVVILGLMASSADVGVFNAAAKLMTIIIIISQIANSVTKPYLSEAFAVNNIEKVEMLALKSTVLVSVVAVVMGTAVFVFAEELLLLFGKDFQQGYLVVQVLVIGKLGALFAGPVGTIMLMGNQQHLASRIEFGTAVLNIVLNVVLILYYGVLGAAIATAITIIGRNLIMLAYVIREFGINPTITNVRGIRVMIGS
jgi:O-antigen/teichoic acid export membrane protein